MSTPIRVLLVEDSKFYSRILQENIGPLENVALDCASTAAEAMHCLELRDFKYDIAVVDLNLPDSRTGDCAKDILKHKISTIVFSNIVNAELKSELFTLGILEYVAKDSPVAVEYLQELISFLISWKGQNVLVVNNDNKVRRKQVRMLENLKLTAWACGSMIETLKMVEKGKEFSFALVSQNLLDTDGVTLVRALRSQFSSSQLAIVAIPDMDTDQAAQYLRYGADDFLRQPYSPEEFYCRIRNAMQMQRQLHALEKAATRDFLTQLLNRRAFFEAATPLFAQAKRSNSPIALAMIDIDFFKRINDTYGHDAGDEVLYKVAQALEETSRASDIVTRFGGEEFCLLMPDIDEKDIPPLFERYREAIEQIDFSSIDKNLTLTISAGVSTQALYSLENMIKAADEALYEAKEAGRDRFIIH